MKTYIVRIPVTVDKAEQVYSIVASSPKDAVAQIRAGDGELLGIEYGLECKYPEDSVVFEEVSAK